MKQCYQIFIVVVMFACAVRLPAQQQSSIDSLLAQLSSAHDTTRVNILNSIAWKYRVSDVAKALDYAHQALKEAEALDYKRAIAVNFNYTGIIYRNLGNYVKAMDYFVKARVLAEQHLFRQEAAYALNNIGEIYKFQRNYTKAREFVQQSLHTFEELRDSSGMYYCCIRLGEIAQSVNDYPNALVFFKRAILYADTFGNESWKAGGLNRIGQVYQAQGSYQQALETFQTALAITLRIRDESEQAGSLINIGDTYLAWNRFSVAKTYLLQGFQIANALGLKQRVKRASTSLVHIYNDEKNYAEALKYQTIQLEMNDSLFSEQGRKEIERLNSKYDLEKKQAEIDLLSKDQDINRLVRNGLIAFLGLILVLVIVLVRGYKQKQRAAFDLEQQNREILRQQEVLEQQATEIEVVNTQIQQTNFMLEGTNETLERRNIEFQKANAALKEADEFRLNMLSIASHDLKNPLHAIIGLSDLITFDSQKSVEYAKQINESSWQMLELIKDLLDSSAREMGKMELLVQPMDMGELVHYVMEKYTNAAANKAQTIVADVPQELWLQGDERRLQQVVDNLISNAVKYAPQNTTIKVTLSESQASDKWVRFSVKDEGPGVSEEDKQRMFGFFQRLSAQPTGGESSNGVGLAIVKQIVDLHEGRVWCESEVGDGLPSGTTFVVELPISSL